ncbi:hypothetical protein JHK87_016693 [Glycine soja]|nr:hypothetical protein JHK87_016693 [Glycine soja]
MDPNQYNYQYYYSYLQNQSLPTMKILKIHRNMLCIDHPIPVKIFKIHHNMLCENSQNPPQYIMYPPPPHMWYMHPSSNVEPPTNGSSQNPQIYSQPSTPTNSNTCYRPSLSNIALSSNEIESPIGVDSIQLDEGDQNSCGKKSRTAFLWLNVSKDSIIGVNQTSKQYWTRIKNGYNNDDVRQSRQFCERSWILLKSRWNRIHPPVQKFNGCYKQVNKHRRSESSEKDVLANAHMIYSQDTGKKFEVEHAWLLLKDQPKLDAKFMSKCSKRTKVSAFGNYSSSSNPETRVEVEEYDMSLPMSFPIGQKAAKRKSKGKESPNTLNLSGIESVMKDKNMNISKLIQLKEAQERHLQE